MKQQIINAYTFKDMEGKYVTQVKRFDSQHYENNYINIMYSLNYKLISIL